MFTSLISEKSLSIGWLSFSQWQNKFSKILIFTWKLKLLSLAINTVSCVSLSDSHTHFIFKKCLPNSKSDNHSLLVVLPSETWCSIETADKSAHKCKQCHECTSGFPQSNHHTLLCWKKEFSAYVLFCHTKY